MSLAAQGTERSEQAAAFARSEYVRDLLQSEYFERQLTDRLIEIATEGRGAVVNAWEPPVAEVETEAEGALDATTESVSGAEAAPEVEADAMAEPAEAETTSAVAATADEEA
jgi:trigger factor